MRGKEKEKERRDTIIRAQRRRRNEMEQIAKVEVLRRYELLKQRMTQISSFVEIGEIVFNALIKE